LSYGIAQQSWNSWFYIFLNLVNDEVIKIFSLNFNTNCIGIDENISDLNIKSYTFIAIIFLKLETSI